MIYQVGIENNYEGRSLVWVLDHPGCFAFGSNEQQALDKTRPAILGYADWIAGHCHSHPEQDCLDSQAVILETIELEVVETWDCYAINEDYQVDPNGRYEVNAWFRQDWKPLSMDEAERAARLLDWSRSDLLDAARGLSPETLNAERPGERWSIAGILRHIGGSECWYLDRLGIGFSQERLPKDPFERLEMVRARLVEELPALIGSRQVVGVDGEFWSPRKLLRRALQHERDHTGHIWQLTSPGGD
jgi:hypothetical protein